MELIVVSGISGSGKSSAIHALEDAGYYCVDNLPPDLLCELARVLASGPQPVNKAAVGMDVRTRAHLEDLPQALQRLEQEAFLDIRGLFLEANEASLLRRFSETRRRHPLAEGGHSLPEAIKLERRHLAPLAETADCILDTSAISVHTLRRRVQDFASGGVGGRPLTLLFQSFGFKHGIPMDSDLLFDIRFLPNPNYEPGLAELTGQDQAVIDYLEAQPELERRLSDIHRILADWVPSYAEEPRSYLTVSIGCTGGRHRSVFMVERLAKLFDDRAPHVLVRHRELGATQPVGRQPGATTE
ncbi:RNase adapter RapZ [Thiohalorhabdus methylotrophus]|uniref:RNase adapter RapZ n=1 Tax=Thiohalorhabdus methylotrophus TaxID=3242694 RepID=A0ABV4TR02_9GAMM